MDTPFKWVKQVASHFGGTAQGLAMSWPGHIKDVGGIRRQFHHVIDIAPTILEATGIPAPDMIDGIKQRPMDGVSMAYTWDKANADAPTKRTTQYFEMLGNRAIYHEGWVAATTPATLPWELSTATPPDVITGYNWELYNVAEDPTESNDLAAKMPDKLKEMQDLFYAEAEATMSCRSTTRRSAAGTRRGPASRPGGRSSPIRESSAACRPALRRASWTSPTPSPPRSRSPRAARKA